MITSTDRIIKNAYRRHKLVVAFNSINAETTLAIARAAGKVGSPTIYEISKKTIDYLGIDTTVALVKAAANEAGGKVPFGLHLDHGRTFEIEQAAIKAGFSSVMIDGSALPLAENIRLTKKVVAYAHKRRIAVQGEVGALVTHSAKRGHLTAAAELMTDPKVAHDFVKQTGVDSLGVAVGTLHGPIKMFRRLPKIDFSRLEQIHKQVKIPLVLHGGSGVPTADLKKATRFGVAVVNIDTELRLAYLAALRWELARHKKEYDPREIFSPVVKALEKVVEAKLRALQN